MWEKVAYLQRLLGSEFVFRKKVAGASDLIQILNFLQTRGFLNLKEDSSGLKIFLDLKDEAQSYKQSFLYHLLLPLVESYWVTLTFFLSQQQAHEEE